MTPFARDPEELLSHRDFVRGLARSLVVDEARADDVVQQAWVAALAGGPREPSSLRAWLGGVVRNLVWKSRRDESRRRERERRAARTGTLPSTAEVVEREAARRAVTAAVFALDEPFRTTLILRHLEGLPQRAIARQMEVPVETVHSRLRTGMARLRRTLDAEYGDRRSWSLLLIPGAVPSVAPGLPTVVASVFAGVAVVSLKAKLALSALAIVVAALLFQFFGAEPESIPVEAAGPVTAAVALPPELDPIAESETHREVLAAAIERESTPETVDPATDDPTRGALEVIVKYAEDGAPAASVSLKLYCWAEPDPYLNLRYAHTDEHGVATIDGILAGNVSVESDRGGNLAAEVAAGEIASVTLEIPVGAEVSGIVVDGEGRPVSGADIFLTSQGLNSDGFIVTRSAADGTFSIRAVGRMHYIGARLAGYAPSQLPLVMGGEGAKREVTLTLDQRGGALAGQVFGPDGSPLRDALVVVDPEVRKVTRLADGIQALDAIELRTRTVEDGSFLFTGVRPGTRGIGVRRPDLATWRGSVDVYEGVTARLEARLLPGAVLVGTVTGANGEPVSGVQIEARQVDGFDEVYGRVDADGEFRLEGLPAGTVKVHAQSDDQGEVEDEVMLVAGEETRWDVSLSLGRSILGRLVDEADRPLEGHWIQVEVDYRHSKEHFRGDAQTGADGRFEVTNCPDAVLVVNVHTPDAWMYPALTVKDVRPGPEEILMRLSSEALPTARIVGTVVDATGAPIAGAKISPSRSGANTSPILLTDAESGAFTVEPLPPGRYRITVQVTGFPRIVTAFHELTPNETWNVGEVRIESPGQLVLLPRREPDCPASEVHPWVERDGTGVVFKVHPDGEQFRSEPLAAGDYHLFVASPPLAAVAIPFQIQSGADTVVDLPLRAGVERRILVDSDAWWIRLRITGSQGVIFEGSVWRTDESVPFEKKLAFSPGGYEVEVSDDSERTVQTSFSVREGAEAATVEMTLR